MAEIELRERGVYVLPDATEVVVCAGGARGYMLYRIEDWEKYEKRDLEADATAGQLDGESKIYLTQGALLDSSSPHLCRFMTSLSLQ